LGFLIVGLAVFAAILFTMIPDAYWARLTSADRISTDRSMGRRLAYVKVGWQAFLRNPFVGTGPGTFRHHFAVSNWSMHFKPEGLPTARAAHNAYLEILVGGGALGLLLFLTIIAAALYNYRRAILRFRALNQEDMASLSRAYMTSLLVMVLAGFMLSAEYHKYLWLGLGISGVAWNLAVRTPSRLEPGDRDLAAQSGNPGPWPQPPPPQDY
jgi:O-antigen ligase